MTRVCASFPAWTLLAWTAFLVPSEHVCLQYGVCGPQTVQNILGEIKVCVHSGGGGVLIVTIEDPQEQQSSPKQRITWPHV